MASSRNPFLDNVLTFGLTALLGALLTSCGSSKSVHASTAEEAFAAGKSKFYDGDYLEAITEFEVVKLQFPGSGVADSAQTFLAESHFRRDEFLLAAEEYGTLRRNYPTSPLGQAAQYRIGLCYYNLAPRSYLDQKYTLRAIDELQTFIEYYPKNDLVHDAEAKIVELNARLAQKDYETGELYMKLERYQSALYYFNSVVEKYHDSPYAEPALLGKIKSLVARKKFSEAQPEIEKFIDKYPDSRHRSELDAIEKNVQEHLNTKSASFTPQQPPDTAR